MYLFIYFFFFSGKTEYDILGRKLSFEDVGDEKNADYSTLIGSHDTEPHPLTNSIPSLIKVSYDLSMLEFIHELIYIYLIDYCNYSYSDITGLPQR